jgi:phage terminase large subunit
MSDSMSIAKAIAIPSGYAKFRLGVKLHPRQEEVLDALFPIDGTPSKVAIVCGNGLGKTERISAVAILYALEMLNCNIVATSATYRQLTGQLLPALKNQAHHFTNWEFLENKIKINGEDRFVAFSTTEQAKWQGWHTTEKHKLFILTDESAGLNDDIFQSIARCSPHYLFVCGSPLGPEGFFYSLFNDANTGKSFKKFKFTKWEALRENGWWIDRKDIEEMESMYGHTHPLVLSSIYAEFSNQIEDGLISLTELEKCYKYPPKFIPGIKHIGIDVAAGADSNVIAYRNGNTVRIIAEWKERDTMAACDRIARELNALKETENINPGMVSLDADGLGIAFVHRLRDINWNINEFHGGATPTDEQYSNKISECWYEGIRSIKNCAVILPDDKYKNDFNMQILSRKQLVNDKGKLKLESKKDMKDRGIHSPDIADAVFIAMSNPNSGAVTNAFHITAPVRSYSYF